MKKFLLLTTLSFLVGCSLPSNVNDLKKSSILIPMLSKLPPEQTYQVLLKEMQNIYSSSSTVPIPVAGTVVAVNGSDVVEGRKVKTNQYQVTLTTKAGFSSALGEVIDIIPNQNKSCPTRMNIRVMNRYWKVHADRIKKALTNKNVLCIS